MLDVWLNFEELNRSESSETLFKVFESIVARLGIIRIAYFCANQNAFKATPPLNPATAPALVCTYPSDYISQYQNREYFSVDPVVRAISRHNEPFRWDTLNISTENNKLKESLWRDAADAGVYPGITIPLRSARNCDYAISLVPHARKMEDTINNLLYFQFLAIKFHHAYLKFAHSNEDDIMYPNLTDREKECLKWIAIGKSAWETGEILRLSEQTVTTYIKSAVKKLNASNRTSAVVKALQMGIIAL